jgi:hypothetical protein
VVAGVVAAGALLAVGCGSSTTTSTATSAAPTTGAPVTTAASTGTGSAGGTSGGTAAKGAKVSANTASTAEITAALTAAGVTNAARWTKEIEEYRPYAADDPTMASLRKNLAKYNPSPDQLEKIIGVLQP